MKRGDKYLALIFLTLSLILFSCIALAMFFFGSKVPLLEISAGYFLVMGIYLLLLESEFKQQEKTVEEVGEEELEFFEEVSKILDNCKEYLKNLGKKSGDET